MKTLPRLAALLLLCQFSVEAQIIYQRDFSFGTPSTVRETANDTSFGKTGWSILPGLELNTDNPYARFDINIATEPTQPNARWYGGFSGWASAETVLPAQWQLSFDLYLPTVEPAQVVFEFNDGTSNPGSMMRYWVTPAGPGWQSIHIDQDTSYVSRQGGVAPRAGTQLWICMASHDADGNPLTISQVGTYTFYLDNIVLEAVPEPSTLAFCILSGALFAVRPYRIRSKQALS